MYSKREALGALGAAPLIAASNVAQGLLSLKSPMTRGVCCHLWSSSRDDVRKTIAALANSNIQFVRWDAPWRAVEVSHGQIEIPRLWDEIIDGLNGIGVRSVIILDYGNPLHFGGEKPVDSTEINQFCKYVDVVARHFSSRVFDYEVWNEWDTKNGGTQYSSTSAYISLVKAVNSTLKSVDAKILTIAGGFSAASFHRFVSTPSERGYYKDFIEADVGSSFDALAIHPYVRGMPYVDTLRSMRSALRKFTAEIKARPALAKKPIYVTEVGWPTRGPSVYAVCEAEQASLIRASEEMCVELNLGAFCVFRMKDDKQSDFYGLFGSNWTPKDASGYLRSWS